MSTKIQPLSIWPKVIAIFIFFAGIFNILSVLILRPTPFLALLIRITPWQFFNFSRIITVISGFILIILARGIWRRKHRAWSLSILILIVSLGSHILKRSPLTGDISLFVVLLMLFFFRHEFKVRSTPFRLKSQIKTAILVIILITSYSSLGYFVLRREFSERMTLPNLVGDYWNVITGTGPDTLTPRTYRAQWFEDSLFTINILSVAVIFAGLFAPLIQSPVRTKEILKEIAELQRQFGWTSVSYFALLADKKYYLPNSTQAIAYNVSNGTAVVIGEPFADLKDYPTIIQDFCQEMTDCGLSTVFYLVTSEHQQLFLDAGLVLLKIGEEALITPSEFSLSGAEMKKIRNSLQHVEKAGVTFSWYKLDQIPEHIQTQIANLHSQWLTQSALPRLTFSLDFFPFPKEAKGYLAIALRADQKVVAAVSFLPYNQGQSLALDTMLREAEDSNHSDAQLSTNGVVESLIAESILYFQKLQVQQVSLGLVALAQTKQDSLTPKFLQTSQALLFRYFHQFYNYQSLFHFKNKFHPNWEPRYVAFTHDTELIKSAIAVIGVHTRRKVQSNQATALRNLHLDEVASKPKIS